MASLVDANVLVYRFDSRFPVKQKAAEDLLFQGIADGNLRTAHQAIVEFLSAVTRPLGEDPPLLEPAEARREAEELLAQFEILYPNESVLRTALRGAAAYQLAWYDAYMWAYAEVYGMRELLSEDFSHGRLYGSVRAVDPFQAGR